MLNAEKLIRKGGGPPKGGEELQVLKELSIILPFFEKNLFTNAIKIDFRQRVGGWRSKFKKVSENQSSLLQIFKNFGNHRHRKNFKK